VKSDLLADEMAFCGSKNTRLGRSVLGGGSSNELFFCDGGSALLKLAGCRWICPLLVAHAVFQT